MEDRGLDERGFVRREGGVHLVQPEFRALVEDFVRTSRRELGASALDSLYVYGSVARGTARVSRSDFDGQVLLDHEPTDEDRAAVRRIEDQLAMAHPEVDGVGVLVHARSRMIDPARRWDEGFHIRVLCAPAWGPDAGADVAPHRPDLDLARRVQGDWMGALESLRQRSGSASTGDAGPLCRATGRRLARVAFTWVMPRWRGWSSDPLVMTSVVARYEPSWSDDMQRAVRLGWDGLADPGLAAALLDGFAGRLIERGQQLG